MIRAVVAGVYFVTFLLAVGTLVTIATSEIWQLIADWQKASMIFSVLVGLCGLLIAFWVYEDEQRLDYLEKRVSDLEDKKNT